MTQLAEPIITSQRVQAEDGTWITINSARSIEGRRETSVVLPGGDPSGPSGKMAKVTEQGRRKVILYRGATPSSVPYAQFQTYIQRGFTTEPTAEPRATPFPCGVAKDDGTTCVKKFQTLMDRIKHIQRYHEVVAPYILNDAEKRTLRGEMGAAMTDVYGAPVPGSDTTDVGELKALITEQGKQIALLMARQESTVDHAMPMKVRVSQKASSHRSNQTKHTCTKNGAFGRRDADCPRCQELMASESAVE